MLPNQRDTVVGYLILRHLHDGDVIDWPLPDDDPHLLIFQGLEARGLIERWRRIWPLPDRYRLTPAGEAALLAVYQPEGAGSFFQTMQQQNLTPEDRRRALSSRGMNPVLWSVLHDPYTHWLTWPAATGPYQRFLWEDRFRRHRRREEIEWYEDAGFEGDEAASELAQGADVFDLDRGAGAPDGSLFDPVVGDAS